MTFVVIKGNMLLLHLMTTGVVDTTTCLPQTSLTPVALIPMVHLELRKSPCMLHEKGLTSKIL
jgi:hypothetical protein